MVNYAATNVALYNLGGSGDNLIADGYVRCTEKIWLDSYVYSTASAALLTTADTVLIGYIPANKKIIGCEVYLPATFAPTNSAISVGPSYSTALLITSSTAYVVASFALTTSAVALNCVRLNNPLGMGFVVTSSTSAVSGGTIQTFVNTAIYMSFSVAITAPTAGTITTILRYT